MKLMTQIAFIVMSFRQNGQLAVGARVLQQFVAFVTNTFIGPMYATGFTLFYYDQRVRKEGYDIEWMMEAAGLTVPAADALGEHEPSPSAYDGWPNGASPLSEGSSPTTVAATSQDVARDHPEPA